MENICYAFICGYLENEIRALVDKVEAEKIIARAEEKAREIYDDYKPNGNNYLEPIARELERGK